jgi:hypothetical protein
MIEQIREGRFDGEGKAAAEPGASAGPRPPDDSEIATARMQLHAEAFFDHVEPPDEELSAEERAAEEVVVARQIAAELPAVSPAEPKPPTESGPAPTLDQVIFDYLSTVAKEESLVLLMDESPALASATTTRIDLGTHASRSGSPVSDAVIAVRMISKTGGPVTLAEGKTDADGTLQLVVAVPEVPPDSAALIITAASTIGNAEIKHLL